MTKTHRKRQDQSVDETQPRGSESLESSAPAAAEPTDDVRELMETLAIGEEAGAFSFAGCRYVELADAVLDATRAWQRERYR